jgi:drug/metabolite transporter (DMT)-like permease
VRRSRRINMVPATAIAGLIAATVCAMFAASLSVTGRDIILLMLMGLFVLPVSFALITLAPRYLPAPEVGLVLLLETLLGPLWVWFALGERVSGLTILGGAVVVSTLVVHSALQLREGV